MKIYDEWGKSTLCKPSQLTGKGRRGQPVCEARWVRKARKVCRVKKATKGRKVIRPIRTCFLKRNSTAFMTGNLNMNKQLIENMLNPSSGQDAVDNRFLESQLDDYLSWKGQISMDADLNTGSYRLINLKDADAESNPADALNKN